MSVQFYVTCCDNGNVYNLVVLLFLVIISEEDDLSYRKDSKKLDELVGRR